MKKKHILHGNLTKPKVTPYVPKYITNTITDNVKDKDGNVTNRLESNADFARDCVDMNKK